MKIIGFQALLCSSLLQFYHISAFSVPVWSIFEHSAFIFVKKGKIPFRNACEGLAIFATWCWIMPWLGKDQGSFVRINSFVSWTVSAFVLKMETLSSPVGGNCKSLSLQLWFVTGWFSCLSLHWSLTHTVCNKNMYPDRPGASCWNSSLWNFGMVKWSVGIAWSDHVSVIS